MNCFLYSCTCKKKIYIYNVISYGLNYNLSFLMLEKFEILWSMVWKMNTRHSYDVWMTEFATSERRRTWIFRGSFWFHTRKSIIFRCRKTKYFRVGAQERRWWVAGSLGENKNNWKTNFTRKCSFPCARHTAVGGQNHSIPIQSLFQVVCLKSIMKYK